MYKLSGKSIVRGQYAAVGVDVVYGRGKVAEVYLVNRVDEPKPDLKSLVSADISKHRFYTNQTIALSVIAQLQSTDGCVTACKGGFRGKTHDEIVRHLQNA